MLLRYLRTIRSLRITQIWYQVWYRLYSPLVRQDIQVPESFRLSLNLARSVTPSEYRKYNLFGTSYNLNGSLWSIKNIPRLQAYHLHYFDFLNDCQEEKGKLMIHAWLEYTLPGADIAWDAYPTSLRIVNWIKFFSRYENNDSEMKFSLYQQVDYLSRRMEYEILGNHLFKNILALLYGAVYFGQAAWEKKALKMLRRETDEQTIEGGYHYELSPTYHAHFTQDLLDAVNILKCRPSGKVPKFLVDKLPKSLAFVEYFHDNRDWININDCNFQDCPDINSIRSYAKSLGISTEPLVSSELFPCLRTASFSIMMDCAPLGPTYMMGHAHADALQVLLWDGGEPILVDSGNYDYVDSIYRKYSRSTAAHNTLEVEGEDQAEMWSVFRVGRRGNIKTSESTKTNISAEYTGYQKRFGVLHERCVTVSGEGEDMEQIIIRDVLTLKKKDKILIRQYFHFHPDLDVVIDDSGDKLVVDTKICFSFPTESEIELVETEYYPRMYVIQKKKTVIISTIIDRNQELKTIIKRSSQYAGNLRVTESSLI